MTTRKFAFVDISEALSYIVGYYLSYNFIAILHDNQFKPISSWQTVFCFAQYNKKYYYSWMSTHLSPRSRFRSRNLGNA